MFKMLFIFGLVNDIVAAIAMYLMESSTSSKLKALKFLFAAASIMVVSTALISFIVLLF